MKHRNPLPTPDELRIALDYDPITGRLFWKTRPEDWKSSKRFNPHFAGKEAFTSTANTGYKQGAVFANNLLAHRVIWAIVHGKWPDFHIDHINGIRTDNRICNLRDVRRVENQRNHCVRSDNKSGVCGVSWSTRDRTWVTRIGAHGRYTSLGDFKCLGLAIKARRDAEVAMGFMPKRPRN